MTGVSPFFSPVSLYFTLGLWSIAHCLFFLKQMIHAYTGPLGHPSIFGEDRPGIRGEPLWLWKGAGK